MRLWIKIPLIAVATLFAAAVVLMTTWRMDINGVWPYKPLQRHERTLTLESGGLLHVVEVENRAFGRVRLRLEPYGSAFRRVVVERFKGDTTKPIPPCLAVPAFRR